ncbi:uncharacterized protein K452DRAFT_360499 [Aplosporella prunicola CBS 121167]|uniref:NAD-dependent epimerase/dehydratase domain-containing protein n=1 Tax=Aplosporella prunicola CBS 121167 TaxID=1176127 RepID=A0A6A6B756_9PEZI|nr:uncharacterized protein K452DRAFT_360499 [Aplosporella prunicola CBS 121167]KAF2139233.1 hypothetical protein K452DRAFT_360499 [Aplosporella prunicola CBS 121167]
MTGKKVFYIGPGFIGWNVVELLVNEGYDVTAMVRRKEHSLQIENTGAKTVFGDLHDKDVITNETAKADIVIHTATADDPVSVEAVLAGISRRAAANAHTIYMHTSGTSVISAPTPDRIYADSDRAAIDALADDAPHRAIDLSIVRKAAELGSNAKCAIMMPPDIYGFNPVHGRLSIQLPTLARFALVHGYAGHVKKGAGVWSAVHVRDLARGYLVLLHALEQKPAEWVLENPYFFCENGSEFSWKEASERISAALLSAGRIAVSQVREIGESEYGELFGPATEVVLWSNSRSRAVRLRELGWEPREKGVFESLVQDELPEILRDWDARTADQKTSAYAARVA